MIRLIKIVVTSVALLALAVLSPACTKPNTPDAGGQPGRTKEQMMELGRQHKTAFELYQTLREEAKGGQRLAWTGLPDWTGVYTRAPVPGFTYDPDQPPDALPTAKLTPEFHAKMLKRIEDAKNGIEWDPISECSPPGHPRWLTEPFLREFIVTPDQTWLVHEMVNDIHRYRSGGCR